jgi:hypothetical protein
VTIRQEEQNETQKERKVGGKQGSTTRWQVLERSVRISTILGRPPMLWESELVVSITC